MSSSAQKRRQGMLALAGLTIFAPLALALAISFAVTPEQIERGDVHVAPACSIRRVLGHPCPTCGLTRAFAALSHGRLDDASGYNRAALMIYLLWWLGTGAAMTAAIRSAVLYLSLRWAAGGPNPLRSAKYFNRSKPSPSPEAPT